MFKSKHSGWTWDLKRTPFGGGNPISGITDSISHALGTDGSGGGALGALASIDPGPSIGNALASIDPGPAIGQGLAEVDKFVNRELPGGWALPAAIAAAVATAGATLPESLAEFMAADAAGLASSGLSEAAIAQNLAASYGLSEAAASAAAAAALAEGATAVGQALPYSELFDAANLAQQGLSSGAIEQNLAATGLNDFLAADMASLAAQGLSPAQIGQTLAYSYSPAELAGTGITSMQATQGGNLLSNVKDVNKVAQLLKQGATSGLTSSLGQLAEGANKFGMETPQIVRGNQNPFVKSDYFQVSQSKPNLSKLAELLKQA